MFIPNGDSDGLRIVEKSNWTGVGVVLKRSNYKQLAARQEADRTGVYILVGDPVEGAMPTIYVGEGDPVKRRLDAHYLIKSFGIGPSCLLPKITVSTKPMSNTLRQGY